MRPSHVAKVLDAFITTQRREYLWSAPGIGKTALVQQAVQRATGDAARYCITVRAAQIDAVDTRGVPTVVTEGKVRRTVYASPSFLPTEPAPRGGVVHLDELAQALPIVKCSLFELIECGRIGEYALPDGWTVWSSSNRVEDRAGASRNNTALDSRFHSHIDVDVSHEDWHDHAVKAGFDPIIPAFIRLRPELLHQFDPTTNPRVFPCPRTWQYASDVLRSGLPDEVLLGVLAGTVGEGPAGELVGYLQTYRELPDLDEVLKRPEQADVPENLAVLYALQAALTERAREVKDVKACGPIVKYVTRFPKEYAIVAMRDLAQVNAKLLTLPESQPFLKEHRALFLSMIPASNR
jgi:hypothetical protein